MPKNKSRRFNRRKGRQYKRNDQISKVMNLHSNNAAVNLQLNHALTIFQNSNSGGYSFSSTVDTRVMTIQAIIAASTFYGDFFSTYEECRVRTLTVYVTPVLVYPNSLTNSNITSSLFLGFDPEFIYTASPSNPTNATVIDSNRAHIISPHTINVNVVTFTFPGVGQSENIFLDTSLNLNGAVYIGDLPSSMSGIISQPAFDVVFSLAIQFRGMRIH